MSRSPFHPDSPDGSRLEVDTTTEAEFRWDSAWSRDDFAFCIVAGTAWGR